MASTIRNLTLECEAFSVLVSLRGASEKQDVTFDTATTDGKQIKRVETVQPIMVKQEVEVEVPPVGKQRKPRKVMQEVEKIAFLPYEGEKIKGVREGDEFFPISADEVEQIEQMTKLDRLTIEEFVSLDEIPWERAQACYFLAPPKGVGAKALKTLHDAMLAKGVGGVAKLMPKSRQKLALIHPKHGGLLVTVLAYADTFAQVVDGAAAISGVEPSDQALELMSMLIDLKKQPASSLDEYRDDLIDLKADLIERAKLGKPLTDEEPGTAVVAPVAPVGGDDTLLERLRESVEQIRKSPSREKVSA